jgi:integral membrane protein
VTDFAGDTTTELERKARALQWVAVVETLGYAALLACMLAGSTVGVRLVGSVHGMIFLAFAAMVVMIAHDMQWSWTYVALVVVTGPIGAVLVYERIRRHGVPTGPARAPMVSR